MLAPCDSTGPAASTAMHKLANYAFTLGRTRVPPPRVQVQQPCAIAGESSTAGIHCSRARLYERQVDSVPKLRCDPEGAFSYEQAHVHTAQEFQ